MRKETYKEQLNFIYIDYVLPCLFWLQTILLKNDSYNNCSFKKLYIYCNKIKNVGNALSGRLIN